MKIHPIIERAGYWKLSRTERENLWADVISEGLRITTDEARRRLKRNNGLPIEEAETIYGPKSKITVYPRFNANASLLAQASASKGPRGDRPFLASASNILRISDITQRQVIQYGMKLRQIAGGISEYLVFLQVTASNPKTALPGIDFSDDDIRSGIYIPKNIDKATSAALGVIYGNGSMSNGGSLLLTTRKRNLDFYRNSVRRIFEYAFNFLPDRDIRIVTSRSTISSSDYDTIHLNYSSKALRTYLSSVHHFPKSREERRETGLSDTIKNISRELQDEFLKYFLASTAAFDTGKALTRINDVSEYLLRDIEDMLRLRLTSDSISFRDRAMGGGYTLSLSTIPSMELYVLGFLNENPVVKRDVETYWNEKLGNRAAKYLERVYGKEFLEKLQMR